MYGWSSMYGYVERERPRDPERDKESDKVRRAEREREKKPQTYCQ